MTYTHKKICANKMGVWHGQVKSGLVSSAPSNMLSTFVEQSSVRLLAADLGSGSKVFLPKHFLRNIKRRSRGGKKLCCKQLWILKQQGLDLLSNNMLPTPKDYQRHQLFTALFTRSLLFCWHGNVVLYWTYVRCWGERLFAFLSTFTVNAVRLHHTGRLKGILVLEIETLILVSSVCKFGISIRRELQHSIEMQQTVKKPAVSFNTGLCKYSASSFLTFISTFSGTFNVWRPQALSRTNKIHIFIQFPCLCHFGFSWQTESATLWLLQGSSDPCLVVHMAYNM